MAHEFHMPVNGQGIGGGGCHDKMVLGQTGRSAVIHRNAIFTQHQPIADLANSQFTKAVTVYFVQEYRGICALNVNFSQRCYVAHANGITGRQYFAVDGLAPCGFTCAWEPLRAHPVANFDKDRVLFHSPRMGRCQTGRVKMLADGPTSQHTHGRRGVRRAEDRCADFGDRLASQFGHDRKATHVRCLALIRRHAERRVPFKVLD